MNLHQLILLEARNCCRMHYNGIDAHFSIHPSPCMIEIRFLTIPTKLFSPRADARVESSSLASDKAWSSCALDFAACSTFLLYTSRHSCSICRSSLSRSSSLSPTSSQISYGKSWISLSRYAHTIPIKVLKISYKNIITCNFCNNVPQVVSPRRGF